MNLSNPTKVYNSSSNLTLQAISDSLFVCLGVVAYDLIKGETNRITYDMITLLVSDYLSKMGTSVVGNIVTSNPQYQFMVKSILTGVLNGYGQKMWTESQLGLANNRSFTENIVIGGASSYVLGMFNNPLNALLGL